MRHQGYVLAAALSTCLATPVAAQAGDQSALEEEEAVVTARKREEKLIEAPLSVTALSTSDLARYQVDDLGGLRDVVPNLSANIGDAANAIVYIRGVGQRDSLSFADPGVGIYLDDVYLGRAQGAFLEVIDIERIEVLRGPQGTLYGRNTIGGAIKYVSAQPSPESEFVVQAGMGEYAQRTARVTWAGPLGSDGGLLGRLLGVRIPRRLPRKHPLRRRSNRRRQGSVRLARPIGLRGERAVDAETHSRPIRERSPTLDDARAPDPRTNAGGCHRGEASALRHDAGRSRFQRHRTPPRARRQSHFELRVLRPSGPEVHHRTPGSPARHPHRPRRHRPWDLSASSSTRTSSNSARKSNSRSRRRSSKD